jgi:hypothetical protein
VWEQKKIDRQGFLLRVSLEWRVSCGLSNEEREREKRREGKRIKDTLSLLENGSFLKGFALHCQQKKVLLL